MSERRYLYIHPLECTGCRICEMSCSLRFFKEVNPNKSRIHVIRTSELIDKPISCHHCDIPWCLNACPVQAIRKSSRGQVVVIASKCMGCRACVEACPFGAMNMNPDTNKAILCTLCGECVKNCPVHKLRIEKPEAISNRIKMRYLSGRKLALDEMLHGKE